MSATPTTALVWGRCPLSGSAVPVCSRRSVILRSPTARPCWVEISRDGKYLFAINTGSANLSRYAIARDGSLSLIGTTAFTNSAGAVDARLSPDGRFLFVTGGRGQVVSGFAVDGGDVTELPGSPTPLPAGTAPTGIVVL